MCNDFTLNNQSFKHDDKPNPSDAYGRSKLNAEKKYNTTDEKF